MFENRNHCRFEMKLEMEHFVKKTHVSKLNMRQFRKTSFQNFRKKTNEKYMCDKVTVNRSLEDKN